MDMSNIAILCSGGDVSGMNPAIKHFVEYAKSKGLTPYLVYDGFEGLIDNNIVLASYKDVSGIINRGGTKIGSARSVRFMEAKYRQIAKENLDALNIDKLVVLGGDGSFRAMAKFYEEHKIAFAGVPSTIDNDIVGTDYCLGVDTALNIIRISLDAIRDTASSFKRAFVVETMGRDCGYLALVSGLTSGAELTLIPEIAYDLCGYKEKFKKELSEGRRYFLAVVSEGIEQSSEEIALWFENEVGVESRVSVLGHIQRGGNPTTRDRLMAYRFVHFAIDGLLSGESDKICCYSDSQLNYKSISDVANKQHVIEPALMELVESMTLSC